MKKLTDDELLEELRLRIQKRKEDNQELLDLMEQLKEVNKKLEQSEALKSKFLSNIRNEINNPFTIILGLAQNMMSIEKLDLAQVKSMAGTIYSEGFDLDFQLKNIFMAADIEAGESFPDIMNVGIIHLLQSLVMTMQHPAGQRNIQLQFRNNLPVSTSEDDYNQDYFFHTDPEKFRLIISNLVNNAINVSPDAGTVLVTTGIEDDNLSVMVEDQGPGIDEADRDRIFERFNQLDHEDYPGRGHGLGLCVTKSMLELLDGEISVKNKKNGGAIFTVNIKEKFPEKPVNDFAVGGDEFFFEEGEIL